MYSFIFSGSLLLLASLKKSLMLSALLLPCPEELTSPSAVLSSSCCIELAEVSKLCISSSPKGFSLCLFSDPSVRGVSLSLFLLISSLRGVWRSEGSTLESVLGGAILVVFS